MLTDGSSAECEVRFSKETSGRKKSERPQEQNTTLGQSTCECELSRV